MIPPDFPAKSVYTHCWCEENVYLLCQKFLADDGIVKSWEPFVLVISNHSKTVALWSQKAAREEDLPVVWDYHVLLVLRARKPSDYSSKSVHVTSITIPDKTGGDCWVYDFDSRLSMPCPWEDYLSATFPMTLMPQYQSLFRVISGSTFLDHFASDRSHMLIETAAIESHGEPLTQLYHSPPPPYEPLCGKAAAELGVSNNLMDKFVCMSACEDCHGEVFTLDEIVSFFCTAEQL
ncbi:N-terminal glutamine amidase-domain-containing protein [Cyathus striatus]|nr:N-terminal glutamine amidase-domain-containing protein [Cyathus striatus]